MYCNKSYVTVASLRPSSDLYIFQSSPVPGSVWPSFTCSKGPGLVSPVSGGSLLKSSCRFHAFPNNSLHSVGTGFFSVFHPQINGFSILSKHVSQTVAVTTSHAPWPSPCVTHRGHHHISCTVAITFAEKQAQISYSFHTISQIEDSSSL